jgi:DHA2 family multidrug resistance protein
MADLKAALISRGMIPEQAGKAAVGLLNKSMTVQAQLKFSVDYYHWLSWLIAGTILIIALFPSVSKTTIVVKNNQPTPLAF